MFSSLAERCRNFFNLSSRLLVLLSFTWCFYFPKLTVSHGISVIFQIKFIWSRDGQWRLLAIAGLCDVLGQILQFIGQPYVSVMVYQLMLQAQVIVGEISSVLRKFHPFYVTMCCGSLGNAHYEYYTVSVET